MTNPATPVTNLDPNELTMAVALSYDGCNAPQVLAKGDDALAAEILAVANDHEIPICNNPLLADLLMRLEIGDHIPQELYLAVAHVIAFAFEISRQAETQAAG